MRQKQVAAWLGCADKAVGIASNPVSISRGAGRDDGLAELFANKFGIGGMWMPVMVMRLWCWCGRYRGWCGRAVREIHGPCLSCHVELVEVSRLGSAGEDSQCARAASQCEGKMLLARGK